MKKLLAIMGAISILAPTTTAVISCSVPTKSVEIKTDSSEKTIFDMSGKKGNAGITQLGRSFLELLTFVKDKYPNEGDFKNAQKVYGEASKWSLYNVDQLKGDEESKNEFKNELYSAHDNYFKTLEFKTKNINTSQNPASVNIIKTVNDKENKKITVDQKPSTLDSISIPSDSEDKETLQKNLKDIKDGRKELKVLGETTIAKPNLDILKYDKDHDANKGIDISTSGYSLLIYDKDPEKETDEKVMPTVSYSSSFFYSPIKSKMSIEIKYETYKGRVFTISLDDVEGLYAIYSLRGIKIKKTKENKLDENIYWTEVMGYQATNKKIVPKKTEDIFDKLKIGNINIKLEK